MESRKHAFPDKSGTPLKEEIFSVLSVNSGINSFVRIVSFVRC